jgi:hypothetical protein
VQTSAHQQIFMDAPVTMDRLANLETISLPVVVAVAVNRSAITLLILCTQLVLLVVQVAVALKAWLVVLDLRA